MRFFQKIRAVLAQRADRSRFAGLALTVIVAIGTYFAFLLADLVEDVVTSDPIVTVDVLVDRFVALFRTPGRTAVFLWMTLLGSWQITLGVVIVATALFAAWRFHARLLGFWVTMIGSWLTTWSAKLLVHRDRPSGRLYVEESFSFPSGHATVAAALYGFLGYALWRSGRRGFALLMLPLIVLIGVSRMYLGVHFLSDVLAGYLVGALWMLAGMCVAELSGPPAMVPNLTRVQRILVGTLFLALLASYVAAGIRYHPDPLH